MTEEEIDRMADNFVNAQDFTRVYSVARKAECGAFWKYGFLAGLKAGRPKWHDLRKNPNDLPLRRCIDSNGDVVGLFRHSWDKKPTWYRYDFHEREWWQMETEPIAWCEIPTYTEE